MGRKCSVYGCRTNYSNEEKGTVYRFPNDESDKQGWIRALPNRDFLWTKEKGICSKHWPNGCKMKVGKGGWEVPVEPPSIFGNVPKSCVPKHDAPKRAENSFTERNAIPDELEKFEKADAVNTTDCVSVINAKFPDCVCYMTETELCVHSRKRCGSIHFFSLFISLSTMVSECYSTFLKVKIPLPNHNVITTYSALHATIHYLTNYTGEDDRVQLFPTS